ncbi:MAG: hypothetical protein K8T90_20075 [Planctomycetes bacterium]|nr:hypothetical protein [Planctomycetota bacterium]
MRHFLAAALVFGAALTGFADDIGDREFTLEIGGRDESLREDCSRRLSAWWDDVTSPDRVPEGWDEKKLGPWSLVTKTSGGGFIEEKPGLVRVILSVGSDALPSRKDAADAFARVVIDGLRRRVAERDGVGDRERLAFDAASLRSQAATAELESFIAQIETPHGGPPDRRVETLTARRDEIDRDVSQTRIDRAVTAKKLETARAAAERAVEIERTRRDADALEAKAAEQADAGPQRDALVAKLATLRARIDELSKSTPSLDSARETVFQLEVELVGLEARGAVLAEERTALTAATAEARRDVPKHAQLVRQLDAARAVRDDAERAMSEWTAARNRRGEVFQIVRAPGPPSKQEKPR